MNDSHRWWESYLVRYLAGNIFAVLCFFYVVWFHSDIVLEKLKLENCQKGELLSAVLSFVCAKDKEINAVNLFVVFVFGFLYMYIASIPIFFAHAVRGLFYKTNNMFFAFFGLVGFAISFKMGLFNIIFFLGIVLFALSFCSVNISSYIENIACKRKQVNNGKSYYSDEYITTYKHLREHGNAYGIILMEIIFTYCLIEFKFSLWFFIAWICFGFYGWFLGQYLEFKMLK